MVQPRQYSSTPSQAHSFMQVQTNFTFQVIQQPLQARVKSEREDLKNHHFISPLPTVRLQAYDPHFDNYIFANTSLFVHCTLIDEHDNSPLASPERATHTRAQLCGENNSSLHQFQDKDGTVTIADGRIALFTFPELFITQEGSYRLRFDLFGKLGDDNLHRIATTKSNVFQCKSQRSFRAVGGEDTALTRLMRQMGVKVGRSRKRTSGANRVVKNRGSSEASPRATLPSSSSMSSIQSRMQTPRSASAIDQKMTQTPVQAQQTLSLPRSWGAPPPPSYGPYITPPPPPQQSIPAFMTPPPTHQFNMSGIPPRLDLPGLPQPLSLPRPSYLATVQLCPFCQIDARVCMHAHICPNCHGDFRTCGCAPFGT